MIIWLMSLLLFFFKRMSEWMSSSENELIDEEMPTSSIFVTQVWEPPDVTETNGIPNARHEEVHLPRPLISSFLVTKGSCRSGSRWQLDFSWNCSPGPSICSGGRPSSTRNAVHLKTHVSHPSWSSENDYTWVADDVVLNALFFFWWFSDDSIDSSWSVNDLVQVSQWLL